MPGTGIEPVRSFLRGILSPLRLPISPPGHRTWKGSGDEPIALGGVGSIGVTSVDWSGEMEARVGIEPAYTELQSAA